MKRSDLLQLEGSRTCRAVAFAPREFRASKDGDTLTYDGYASVTGTSYEVYGGPPYGWNEIVQRGAFNKTLKERADVAFLINHEGLTLARTKSGTLSLEEDKNGLHAVANLDARMNVVNDLQVAVERGDVNEMSFAFRVVKDEWFDERGDPSNDMVGTERRIAEINMDHGDVSAVNYGANPATSGGFRNYDKALAELRDGRLSDSSRTLLADLALTLALGEDARATEITPPDVGPHQFEPTSDTGICKTCGFLESNHPDEPAAPVDVVDNDLDESYISPKNTPITASNAAQIEMLLRLKKHHEQPMTVDASPQLEMLMMLKKHHDMLEQIN